MKKTQDIAKEKRRLERVRKDNLRNQWANKFYKLLLPLHKNYTKSVVTRLMLRIDRAIPQIQARSKKLGVECKLTLSQLRRLVFQYYGTRCRFCGKILVVGNFVIDHIIPISFSGTSNIDNLQIICKSCNTRKGSLDEEDYIKLLQWLDTMPPYFKKNVLTRLAGGRG